MEPVFLFGLSFDHAEWASVRQATVAGNIANADTPGYRARDIEPFRSALDRFSLAMEATHPSHLAVDYREIRVGDTERRDGWEISHSGNSVSIEEDLMKASQASRAHRLDMSVMQSFHRMLLTSVRSQ